MATLSTAGRGSSNDAIHSKLMKGVPMKPVVEEGLTVMIEEKLVLEYTLIPVTKNPFDSSEYGTAGGKQHFHRLKKKEKFFPERHRFGQSSIKYPSKPREMKEASKELPQGTQAMSGVKPSAERKMIGKMNLKNRSDCSAQPLPKEVERKEKLVLEYTITPVTKKRFDSSEYGTAGGKQHFHKLKKKEKFIPERPTFAQSSVKYPSKPREMKEASKEPPQETQAMSDVKPSAERKMIGKKNLKNRSACSAQPLPKEVESKSYCVEMEEEEYESLEVFKSHTCKPGCGNYFVCDKRVHAVELHFKKFIESVFGRGSAKMVQGLDVEYNFFTCHLTDEQAKILEGKQGVVNVELVKVGGWYC